LRSSPGDPGSSTSDSPALARTSNIEGVVEGYEQEVSWVLHIWYSALFTAALLLVFVWLEPWVTLGTWGM
jgi:hypothetical protein